MTKSATNMESKIGGAMARRQARSGTLQRRILFSHLQLAAIGFLFLWVVLFVSVWQRSNVRTLVLEKGPAMEAALKARSGIQRSVSDLQGWVALNDDEFKSRRRLAWTGRVEPALGLLRKLSEDWHDPVLVALLEDGLNSIDKLKISQWWVEDVAHTPGNKPLQVTYETLLEPVENELFLALKVLVSEQEMQLLKGQNPELYQAMIRLREELGACVDVLDELLTRIKHPHPAELFAQHFSKVERASIFINTQISALNLEQRDALRNILHELSAYENYATTLFQAWKDGPLDIARQRMTTETAPLATRTMEVFDRLSSKLALQMRNEENNLRLISNAFAGFLALGILVVAVLALLISRRQAARLVQPLVNLTRVSTQLAEGQVSELLPVDSVDELGRLTQAFNAMAIQIQKRTRQLDRRVREAERHSAEMTEVLSDLRVSNQELDAFTSTVSHDLRAPLRHISGFAAVLQEREGGQLDARAQSYLTKISSSAEKLGKLIDDLLDFSRAGQMELQMITIDMNRLFRDVCCELDESYRTPVICWQIGPLPRVKGDIGTLRQVVVNLLDNAAKYSQKESVPQVEISARQGGQEVVFYVRDNGVGFDPAYTEKLFNVFQRLHREHEFVGTGIGLASVRRIITRHGGWVKAESQCGEGACFSFALPLRSGGYE